MAKLAERANRAQERPIAPRATYADPCLTDGWSVTELPYKQFAGEVIGGLAEKGPEEEGACSLEMHEGDRLLFLVDRATEPEYTPTVFPLELLGAPTEIAEGGSATPPAKRRRAASHPPGGGRTAS